MNLLKLGIVIQTISWKPEMLILNLNTRSCESRLIDHGDQSLPLDANSQFGPHKASMVESSILQVPPLKSYAADFPL